MAANLSIDPIKGQFISFSRPLVGRAGAGVSRAPKQKKASTSFLKKRSKRLLFSAAPITAVTWRRINSRLLRLSNAIARTICSAVSTEAIHG
jgi:hypothetical protein